jgi:hypothetical protein
MKAPSRQPHSTTFQLNDVAKSSDGEAYINPGSTCIIIGFAFCMIQLNIPKISVMPYDTVYFSYVKSEVNILQILYIAVSLGACGSIVG